MLHINCNVCILLQPLGITTVTTISYVIKIYTYHSQELFPDDIGVLKLWPYFAVEMPDLREVSVMQYHMIQIVNETHYYRNNNFST